MERRDGVGDGSLQSHSGANPNPKMAKNRGSVPRGGEANGVALTTPLLYWHTIQPVRTLEQCFCIVPITEPNTQASAETAAWHTDA
jgi:hypothetical protein